MKNLLQKTNWTQIQSKRVKNCRNVYLIALTGIDQKIDRKLMYKQNFNTNPFPEIGGILFDVENNKILCTHYRSKEDIMKNIAKEGIQEELIKRDI